MMQILFDTVDQSENVVELHLDGDVFNDEFKLGASICPTITLKVLKPVAVPSVVNITSGAHARDFIVQEASEIDEQLYQLDCADRMILANQRYPYTNNNTPFSFIVQKIAGLMGVTAPAASLNLPGMTKTTSINDDNLSCRDYLNMIAEYNCGYWIVMGKMLAFYSWTGAKKVALSKNIIDENCGDIKVGNSIKINRLTHTVGTYPLAGDDKYTYELFEDNQLINDESDIEVIYNNMGSSGIEFANLQINRVITDDVSTFM